MLVYWNDISFGCCSTAGRPVLKGVLDTQWIQWHVPWERPNVHGISLPGQWWVLFIPFITIAPSSYCKLRVCGYGLASIYFVNRTSYHFAQKDTLKSHLLVSSCCSFDCCLVLRFKRKKIACPPPPTWNVTPSIQPLFRKVMVGGGSTYLPPLPARRQESEHGGGVKVIVIPWFPAFWGVKWVQLWGTWRWDWWYIRIAVIYHWNFR